MFLGLLTLLVALGLSGCSAYFSVIGLSVIFSGSYYSVLAMGGMLELAKLVTASWLYNNWTTANRWLKSYLFGAVIILMLITSMGVFGYLSKAHIEQGRSAGEALGRIEFLVQAIDSRQVEIDQARATLKNLDQVIEQALIKGKSENTAANANWLRSTQKKERDDLNKLIETRTSEIRKFRDEKVPLDAEVRKLEVEMGPLKYVAEMIYGDKAKDNFDKAVRWSILAIVFVFDPLAVLLLVAANSNLRKKPKSPESTGETIKYVDKPIEVIKEVIKEVEKIVEKPIEIIKEVDRPVEIIKEIPVNVPVEVEIYRDVYKDRLVYVNENNDEDGKYFYAQGQIGFGTAFPDEKHLSKYFIRIDEMPSKVYEHAGKDWILVDHKVLDKENIEMYVLYLIDQISAGKIKLNDLVEIELTKVEDKLKQHVSSDLSRHQDSTDNDSPA